MSARVSAVERIAVAHRAEAEIMRYAGDHALWHRHVHGVTLDPMQILKCVEMDRERSTIDVSCRRTGKTAVKEMYLLKHAATTPHQEIGIVAPRVQQSITNINYHLDAIRRSPMLAGYIDYRQGRPQMSDTKYRFANKSGATTYGIMSQIDGDGLAAASIEEVDDMPQDRLLSRFLPMLGAARRLGVDAGRAAFQPQVRVTGVYKGADVISRLLDSQQYHLLPAVDIYLGIELGILNEAFVMQMRQQLPEPEYIRQFLCRNVASQNHIWEKHIRRALAVGVQAGIEQAQPMPGMRYKKRGLISFGYDHSGHGEALHASKSALVVTEQLGNFVAVIYCQTWPAGTDDPTVMRDLLGLWEYFNPDTAVGDAYGVGMLTTLNDMLYQRGLTHMDRRTIGGGDSTASTWAEWAFAPVRFEGMTKHSMATALRSIFHNGQACIAPYDEAVPLLNRTESGVVFLDADKLPAGDGDFALLVRQLANVKALPTQVSYSSYKMADPKIGDDLFDAACAAVWGLITRGIDLAPTVVAHRVQTREQLLGLTETHG